MYILENEISAQYMLLESQLPRSVLVKFKHINQTLIELAQKCTCKEKLANHWVLCSARAKVDFSNVEVEKWSSSLQGYTWSTTDLVRFQFAATLLFNLSKSMRVSVLTKCFQYADDDEKMVLLLGLSILSPGGELAPYVVNLSRTNNSNVFASMALHNSWPSEHLSDSEFEKMVLKALFLGLNIHFIYGLQKRRTSRLSQLAFDYLCERESADRGWPQSIYAVISKADLSIQQTIRLNTLPEQAVSLIMNNNN